MKSKDSVYGMARTAQSRKTALGCLSWLPRYYVFRKYYLPNKHDLVLDAGCGSGKLTGYLTENEINVIGVDRTFETLPQNGDRFLVSDVSRLPMPSNTFDLVISLDVLSYVRSPREVLEEFRRVLKPHGSAVISVPFEYTRSARLFTAQRLLRRFLPRCLLATDGTGCTWFDYSRNERQGMTGSTFTAEMLLEGMDTLFEIEDQRYGINVFSALATDLVNALKYGRLLAPFLFFWAVRLDCLFFPKGRGYLLFLKLRKLG